MKSTSILSNQKSIMELSPGELSLLEYFKIKISERLLNIVRVFVTNRSLELAKEIEFVMLEEYEKTVQKFIDENFFLLSKVQQHSRFPALFTVANDANCYVHGIVTPDICNPHHIQDVEETEQGWVTANYADFQDDLGMSKEIAKKCLERLEQRGFIEKKRGIGAMRIRLVNLDLVIEYIKNASLVWAATEYSKSADSMRISNEYDYMITLAKSKYDFQSFYENQINVLLEKLEINANMNSKKELASSLVPKLH